MEYKHFGLYTDLYELTMIQGYFLNGRVNEWASFDYFFRKNPFGGGYTVFAGLNDLLHALETLRFEEEDLEYLSSQGFTNRFLDFLADFRFRGDVFSVREGELVFPNEPVLTVRGSLIETQLVETLVLNFLNYQSLIATKAARIRSVCASRIFIDFGMRRAHGMGSLMASRAAVIGGADASSNVLAGFEYGIPVTGTMAHSWVQSFDDEYTAFLRFAELYPENTILLVDTYDTLHSGIPNAIKLAKDLKKSAFRLKGIRLDSGDFLELSKKARQMLDEAGLVDVRILVSNQQDEFSAEKLLSKGAPIDGFGIGTNLVVGRPDAALDGVYKLSSINGQPSIKLSDNTQKTSIPGMKECFRMYDSSGQMKMDLICEAGAARPEMAISLDERKEKISKEAPLEPLSMQVMLKGKKTIPMPHPLECARYLKNRMETLPAPFKLLSTKQAYAVALSQQLFRKREKMIKEIKRSIHESTDHRRRTE